MFTRRQALLGVAGAAALASMPPLTAVASETDLGRLPREKVTLVAPPFVHRHDQVAKGGPKVIEFTMHIERCRQADEGRRQCFKVLNPIGIIAFPMHMAPMHMALREEGLLQATGGAASSPFVPRQRVRSIPSAMRTQAGLH